MREKLDMSTALSYDRERIKPIIKKNKLMNISQVKVQRFGVTNNNMKKLRDTNRQFYTLDRQRDHH